ncbi:hypothetical protein WT27_06940 [Burkholderia territorii]|uniref:Uncharacterized protein n=1 Tax=Burkholderia territorii TaxID=1503055 RepID=A0A105VE95_9BURK|nr:hypothetical protein WT27_06940 [Burkholderia territorii]
MVGRVTHLMTLLLCERMTIIASCGFAYRCGDGTGYGSCAVAFMSGVSDEWRLPCIVTVTGC